MEDYSLVDIVQQENAERGKYIRDDVDAERALKRLHALRKEREELLTSYKERMEAIQRRYDMDVAIIEDMLADYFGRVPHRKTKTQESYQLANGRLAMKRQEPEYSFDNPRVVDWLKQNAQRYVKVEEKPDWLNLKKLVAVEGDRVVFAETGEYIPGITAERRDDKFTINITEDK